MATSISIGPGKVRIAWLAPTTQITALPWTNSAGVNFYNSAILNGVNKISPNGQGYSTNKPSSTIKPYTQFEQVNVGFLPNVYELDLKVAIIITDSSVLAIYGGVSTPTATRLVVTKDNQRYNSRTEANNGGTRYDANTVFSILTDSSTLEVNTYGYNQAGYDMNAGSVWVNGAPFMLLGNFANGKTGAQKYTLTNIPGSGMRTVDIYAAGHQNTASTNQFVNYISLVDVVVPIGSSGQIVGVTKKTAEAIFVFGDSTTQAGGTNNPGYSWPRILNRDLRPNSDIYVAGHSAMVGGRFLDTAAKRQALLAEYKATRSGYTKGIFWYDSMVNDAYFDAYTPAQLNSFYSAFIQLFLADTDLANDIIYFKTAIARTAGVGEGSNGLGQPLGAYRDAMNNAVNAAASARVRSADGPTLQRASYLVDGTHVTQEGDVYIAGTINTLLNQGTSAGGILTQVNAVQAGRKLTLSTDSLQAVQYRVGDLSYQSSADFLNLPAGTYVAKAKLAASPFTEVSSTITVNAVIYGADVTKTGPGWTAGVASDRFSGWYTSQVDSTTGYEFNFTNGFIIYQNRQENCPEFIVSIDGGAPIRVAVSGQGFDYNEVRTYISALYTDGATHRARITPGVSAVMNFYTVELIGTGTGTPPSGTQIMLNSEFNTALVGNFDQGWVATTPNGVGGTASISGGQAFIDASNRLTQRKEIVGGVTYRLELDVASVQSGAHVSIGGTGGPLQLNTYWTNDPDAGGSAGVYTRTVSAPSSGSFEFYVEVSSGSAVVNAVRLFSL